MKLLDYLGISEEQLQEYINQRLIDVAHHDEFPLEMFTYGRACIHDNVWDDVTVKCRGLIVNTETGVIVARPFEKFFNLGTTGRPETVPPSSESSSATPWPQPEVQEKLDGFLCTMYTYQGVDYIASKGSFHSPHAKWATAWYSAHAPLTKVWPDGYTPVFEGITPNIRIVVDYGKREGLVLLALINRETGEELSHESLELWANMNGVETPKKYDFTWQEASMKSITEEKNIEGYVLVWRRPGVVPLRVKVKYIDYLRVHRMVTGTSPKAIFETLSGNTWTADMDEMLNASTPWFSHFVSKWKDVLETEFARLLRYADAIFQDYHQHALDDATQYGRIWTRKEWADRFTTHQEVAPVLFALLDGKNPRPIIWKLVKPLTKSAKPLVDARL